MRFILFLVLVGFVLMRSPLLRASDQNISAWTSFRNGGASTVTGTLPKQWGPESIAWQCELSGYGQSTPIIHNGRVYITSVIGPMKEECQISCYDLQTGKEVWQLKHASSAKAASNYMASRAAPTPVVDDKCVFGFFESGDCLAVDLAGKLIWHRSLSTDYGKFDNNHGLGSSPAQTSQHLIVNVEHRGPSYLIALNKSDGSTAWKRERGSSSSWSSPIVLDNAGKSQIVVSSGGTVDGYDSASGEGLWSIGGLDGNSVPSPTPSEGVLFVGARVPEFGSDGQAARSNLCINLRGQEAGRSTPTVEWRASKAISDYASPVVCANCVYYLNKVGVLYCLDHQTGEAHYAERLGTQCWATPIVSEDRIYFFGKDGKTQIVRGGPKFELIASNVLWDSATTPKPEVYVENNSVAYGQSSSSGESTGDSQAAQQPPRSGPPGGGRGSGMMNSLLKADANADGSLSPDEIPAEFKPMLARIDTNSDGTLDASEMKAMAESFAARRSESRDGARDPIVYGAAAIDGVIVIRTGTRLYAIR